MKDILDKTDFTFFKKKYDEELLYIRGAKCTEKMFENFRTMVKILDEVYTNMWEIDISYRPESESKICTIQGFIIHFETLTINNKLGQEHLIRNLFIKLPFSAGAEFPKIIDVFGARTTYTSAEYASTYAHSHLDAYPSKDFSTPITWYSFCKGSGGIVTSLNKFNSELTFKENRFYGVLMDLYGLLKYESLEGIPYRNISRLSDAQNALPRISYNNITNTATRWHRLVEPRFEFLLKYILTNLYEMGKLKLVLESNKVGVPFSDKEVLDAVLLIIFQLTWELNNVNSEPSIILFSGSADSGTFQGDREYIRGLLKFSLENDENLNSGGYSIDSLDINAEISEDFLSNGIGRMEGSGESFVFRGKKYPMTVLGSENDKTKRGKPILSFSSAVFNNIFPILLKNYIYGYRCRKEAFKRIESRKLSSEGNNQSEHALIGAESNSSLVQENS